MLVLNSWVVATLSLTVFASLSQGLVPLSASSRPRIFVVEAEEGFVDDVENLEDGEVLCRAVKAFAEREDGTGENDFLCAGALVQRPYHSSGFVEHDMWVADSDEKEGLSPNLQAKGAAKIIDDLFLAHLLLEEASLRLFPSKAYHLTVQTGLHSPSLFASHHAALSRGFQPCCEVWNQEGEEDGLRFNVHDGIRKYTSLAWESRGLEDGNLALRILSLLSRRRVAMEYNEEGFAVGYERTSEKQGKRLVGSKAVALRIKDFLPRSQARQLRGLTETLIQSGGLSEEPDSVDGAPSMHVSLVANGAPCFEIDANDNMNEDKKAATVASAAKQILEIVGPSIQERILPRARKVLKCETAVVSDIFIRHYGPIASSVGSLETVSRRSGIPAHYDVFSLGTAVVALDDSSEYPGGSSAGGLFTYQPRRRSEHNGSGGGEWPSPGSRLFFPLASGDALLHSSTLCHGVDIPTKDAESSFEDGNEMLHCTNRTSLVVWFSLDEASMRFSRSLPWLEDSGPNDKEEEEDNDVKLFVQGSYIESRAFEACNDETEAPEEAMEKYIRSSRLGNTHALCRLGTLTANGALPERYLSRSHASSATLIEEKIFTSNEFEDVWRLPLPLSELNDKGRAREPSPNQDEKNRLSQLFWFVAALRGNSRAQEALGDCCAMAVGEGKWNLEAETWYALACCKEKIEK